MNIKPKRTIKSGSNQSSILKSLLKTRHLCDKYNDVTFVDFLTNDCLNCLRFFQETGMVNKKFTLIKNSQPIRTLKVKFLRKNGNMHGINYI